MRHRMFILLFALVCTEPASAATTVVTAGEATISHDTPAGSWSLTAGGTTLTLALDPSRDFQVLQLLTSSPRPWIVGSLAEATVMVNGASLVFGSRAAGFLYRNVTSEV